MIVQFLNSDFVLIDVLDTFASLIWSDRFYGCGDFVLKAPITDKTLSLLTTTNYLSIKESEHIMTIENIEIKSEKNNGDWFVVKGRSLESILERRIVANPLFLIGAINNCITAILNANVVNPALTTRKMTRFEIEDVSTNTEITSILLNSQVDVGTNVLNIITNLCYMNSIGFKILLTEDEKINFVLYTGVDRSENQETNPYVVFSNNFDNLISTSLLNNITPYKNSMLAIGTDDAYPPSEISLWTYLTEEFSDLERRETFKNVGRIMLTINGVTPYGVSLMDLATVKAKEALSEEKNSEVKVFDAEIDPNSSFVYQTDYNLGDVVQINDQYGHKESARITEIIISNDINGTKTYPIFEII